VTIYRASVPQDLANPDRPDGSVDAYALAEMMAVAEGVTKNWNRMGVVSFADGSYLELQARQVGLRKQSSENDDALRARVQTPPLALTPDLILQAIQQIVDSNGGGPVFMIEIPRDGLYLSRRQWLSRDEHVGDTVVVVRIPASANCLAACTDALRAKRAAGKGFLVQEYTVI
jgi:hypothetical protein